MRASSARARSVKTAPHQKRNVKAQTKSSGIEETKQNKTVSILLFSTLLIKSSGALTGKNIIDHTNHSIIIMARTKRCSHCRALFYCSTDHQKKEWKLHKNACRIHRQYLQWFHQNETALRVHLASTTGMQNIHVRDVNRVEVLVTEENYESLSQDAKVYYWEKILISKFTAHLINSNDSLSEDQSSATAISAMISLGLLTSENLQTAQVPDFMLEYYKLPRPHPWLHDTNPEE